MPRISARMSARSAYNIKTIDYYLSEHGIEEFSKWYSSKESLSPIKSQLDILLDKILSTKWLEYSQRISIRNEIKQCITDFIYNTTKKKAITIYQNWIKEMEPFCFQGGFGYEFSYPDSPHHWVIRPEYYNTKGNIPEIVEISACILGYYIYMASTAKQERWA